MCDDVNRSDDLDMFITKKDKEDPPTGINDMVQHAQKLRIDGGGNGDNVVHFRWLYWQEKILKL